MIRYYVESANGRVSSDGRRVTAVGDFDCNSREEALQKFAAACEFRLYDYLVLSDDIRYIALYIPPCKERPLGTYYTERILLL